ncbi:concanavalin A-like lectin/glucanase domain-containing protein [Pyrenochaeta sp. MPI-SDFR-AT-0127]|nr:concanavalin A-like lectin/glucanase domain-containing protein [Pyrenochaeta sp. MPI-SDFR-AT-0127]
MHFTTFISATAFFELSRAAYVLKDDYMTNFYGDFNFFTEKDPTDGFVKYVDQATATQAKLINASSTTAVQWGVDFQTKDPAGRASIRLESKKLYDNGLFILDVQHMPFGCGTWPAFWTVGGDWPNNGEIDILENVNEATNNGVTLHTGPGCQIGQDLTQFSGSVTTPNCDVAAKGQGKNVGCSIKTESVKSYGAGLNQNGGGVYATEWTAEAISVWFFPRESIPTDVLGDSPDPSGWGLPVAKFSGGCDIPNTFKQHKIVFDTTFCGQWAGSPDVWDVGSCGKKAPTCNEYVRDNPEAFADAYWTINALRVYQSNGQPTVPGISQPSGPSTNVSVPVPVPTTNVVPGLPSQTPIASIVPGAPIYANTSRPVSLPGVPLIPSTLQTRSTTIVKKPVMSPIAAPSGALGMAGFQWPLDAPGQPTGAPANSLSATRVPVQTPRVAPGAPTPVKNLL